MVASGSTGNADGRRKTMTPGSPGGGVRPARRVMLGQEVADRLREAILTGSLPPGTHLVEERMAAQLEVSRGPVREAFARLEQEGLITLLPHRGGAVKSLAADDVEEVYALRLALEPVAVRLAAFRNDAEGIRAANEVIDRFAEALESEIDAHTAAQYDLEFHDALYRIAGNQRLFAAWNTLRAQVYLLLLARNLAEPDWRERMVGGHRSIIDAVERQDADEAESLLRDHLRFSFQLIASNYGFDQTHSSFLRLLDRGPH